jgi:CRP/FNR family nitrogen fixation transcriptional regulator
MSTHAFLQSADAFAAVRAAGPSQMEAFSQVGVSMSFAPDEEIYAQDEETDFVYQVRSGAVRASRLLSDGRRQIAGFYYPGDLFGLETGPVHRSAAETLGDTKVLVARRSALRRYGQAGERLERLIWQATGEELERAHEHMMLLGRKSALEKVAGFLASIARRRHGAWSELVMSRQDIADHLGLSIETVSRMVTQLQADNTIAFDGCRRFQVLAHNRLAHLAAA